MTAADVAKYGPLYKRFHLQGVFTQRDWPDTASFRAHLDQLVQQQHERGPFSMLCARIESPTSVAVVFNAPVAAASLASWPAFYEAYKHARGTAVRYERAPGGAAWKIGGEQKTMTVAEYWTWFDGRDASQQL